MFLEHATRNSIPGIMPWCTQSLSEKAGVSIFLRSKDAVLHVERISRVHRDEIAHAVCAACPNCTLQVSSVR